MIENLDKIRHPDLRKNIIQLRNDIIEIIIDKGGFTNDDIITKNHINRRLHEYVLGIDAPISICDSHCYTYKKIDYKTTNTFCVELAVDYRVTYGYTPYQTLDKPIQLSFKIFESDIRDYKLKQILN